MEYIRQNPLIVRRFVGLGLAAVAGVLLARYGVNALQKWIGAPLDEYSIQLALLLLSLPVLCALWQFRTADTQAQITKATEGVAAARDATSISSLERYIETLSSDRLMTRRHGLIQLVKIKRKGAFAEKIDDATRQHLNLESAELRGENLSGLNLESANFSQSRLDNANLSGTNLRYAQMRGANLFSAILQKANLEAANLEGADMRNADFSDANLWEANLEKANLIGADLSSAENLDKAKLTNAVYDHLFTKFPADFDPEKAGMKAIPIKTVTAG